MTAPQGTDSALLFLQKLLAEWGLESLNDAVKDMLTAGDAADVIPLKLRETDVYKKRFAGNAARIRNNLPALSEAEYLATEASLKDVVRRYVGAGIYDTRDNLEKWISKDVAPQELNTRMQAYQENFLGQPDWVKQAWATKGYTPADAISAVIDPNVTETTLRRQLGAYSLGSEAIQAYRDTNALDTDQLERYANAGVTAEQARRGFGEVAAREKRESMLAGFAGQQLSRGEQESAALLNDATAEEKRRKILETEQGRFGENYLGTVNAFNKNRAGQF